MPERIRILIANLHSAQNLGDLIIVEQTMNLLRQKYSYPEFVLMSTYPATWNQIASIKNIPSFFRLVIGKEGKRLSVKTLFKICINAFSMKMIEYNLRTRRDPVGEALHQIAKADIVYSTGGGNFYSNSRIGLSFVMNSLTLIIAGKLGKRIIMLPQSFGPLKLGWQRRLLKLTLNYVEVVFAREKISYDYLLNIGVPLEKLKLLPDLAFTFPPPVKNEREKLRSDKLIALAIIDRKAQFKKYNKQKVFESTLIQYIEYILTSSDYKIRLLVQCNGPTLDQDDTKVSNRIASIFQNQADRVQVLDKFIGATDFVESIAQADLIISTRLHTGILGLVCNVPSIMIGYQPKAEGLYKMLGLEELYSPIDFVNFTFLRSLTEGIFAEYEDYQQLINRRVSKISKCIETAILEN